MLYLVKDMSNYESKPVLQRDFDADAFLSEGVTFTDPETKEGFTLAKVGCLKIITAITFRSLYSNEVVARMSGSCVFRSDVAFNLLPFGDYPFDAYVMAAVKKVSLNLKGTGSDYSLITLEEYSSFMMRSKLQLIGLLYDSEPVLYYNVIFNDEDWKTFKNRYLNFHTYTTLPIKDAKCASAYKDALVELVKDE